MPLDEVSAVWGWGYGLGAFIDPVGKETVYGIRGGTQRVAGRLAATLDENVVRVGRNVTSIRTADLVSGQTRARARCC
jgi:hypothetical protein